MARGTFCSIAPLRSGIGQYSVTTANPTSNNSDDITNSLAASTKVAKEAAVEMGLRVDPNPRAVPPVIQEEPDSKGVPRFAVQGLFTIAIIASLYFAQEFFLPVILAFILALTLSPLVRWFSRRGVPAALSAVVIVVSMFLTTLLGAYTLMVPVSDWVDRAPEIGRQLESKLSVLRAPMEAIKDAEKQVDDVSKDADVQTVTVKGPGLMQTAASSILSALTSLTITAVLLAFLLGSGDLFYSKLVRTFDTLKDKKRALKIAHDVERVVSRYLFTITLINISLGIVVGVGMWFLGMPTPYIFGIIAALANFIPYIGALIGMAAAVAVAVVSFDTLSLPLMVGGFYFMCTFLEGQVITPLIVGRRLQLNAVAVFISVAFWAWLWGIVGALLAVPMLVIIKTICDHFEVLDTLGEFLSGRDHEPAHD